MGNSFSLNAEELERLSVAFKDAPEQAEETINDVLHTQAAPLLKDEIYRLMPASGKSWKGKKPHAKFSQSLMQTDENLSVTIRTKKDYHYLYFPDDGSNTRRHAGNQQFFSRSLENKREEIINRCVGGIVEDFNE